MDKEIIFLVEESAEGGYEARAFGYSIYTEEESIEGLKKAIADAVKRHFEEKEMPRIIRSAKQTTAKHCYKGRCSLQSFFSVRKD